MAALIPAVAACGSQYAAVERIRDATVPAGDRVAPLSAPEVIGQSIRFTWEFDTRSDPATYLDRVAGELTRDGFTVQQRTPSRVALTRLDGGDVYRIGIESVGQAPAHVRVTLVVSPG